MRQLGFEADQHVLGRVGGEQLPMIAAQALARGIDSPALCELAGLGRSDLREAAELFTVAMAELGRPLRDHHVVRQDRIIGAAHDLQAGSRPIPEAAGEIAWLMCRCPEEHPDRRYRDLAIDFELLVIDWQEQPPRRPHIETLMTDAAQRLLHYFLPGGLMETLTLWRPTGPQELDLVRESGWRAWPPRLPDQPIFYPVLNEQYAIMIARDWNVPASGVGYVTRFEIDAEFAARYPVQQAGGKDILELWVPAEDLNEFNQHIVGTIEVIHEFRPDTVGDRPSAPQG